MHSRASSHCDGGYKPLDCRSYPLFPTSNVREQIATLLKGEKCPLSPVDLEQHAEWVMEAWRQIIQDRTEVADWLIDVSLVGYRHYFDCERGPGF